MRTIYEWSKQCLPQAGQMMAACLIYSAWTKRAVCWEWWMSEQCEMTPVCLCNSAWAKWAAHADSAERASNASDWQMKPSCYMCYSAAISQLKRCDGTDSHAENRFHLYEVNLMSFIFLSQMRRSNTILRGSVTQSSKALMRLEVI